MFFGAGSLILIGGLAALSAWLAREDGVRGTAALTSRGLALRGMTRRRSRSLAMAGLLASGTFLVVAIGAFRMDAQRGAWDRSAGTGGFGLIAEGSLPVVQDLNTEAGLEAFGLGATDLPGVRFVPFRVRDGDDASCLNLDRAQRPRLLGVRPELAGRTPGVRLRPTRSGRDCQRRLAGAAGFRVRGPGGRDRRGRGGAGRDPGDRRCGVDSMGPGKKIGDTLEVADERGERSGCGWSAGWRIPFCKGAW